MIDRVDVEEYEDDERQARADARRVAEHNADSANDEPTFEETKRAAAAAYSAQFIGAGALWALRGLK